MVSHVHDSKYVPRMYISLSALAALASSEPNIDPIIGVAAATVPKPLRKLLLESESFLFSFFIFFSI